MTEPIEEELKAVKAPISERDMLAAELFALDLIRSEGPIAFRSVVFRGQTAELNRFALHDAIRDLGKRGVITATGIFGYGDLEIAP